MFGDVKNVLFDNYPHFNTFLVHLSLVTANSWVSELAWFPTTLGVACLLLLYAVGPSLRIQRLPTSEQGRLAVGSKVRCVIGQAGPSAPHCPVHLVLRRRGWTGAKSQPLSVLLPRVSLLKHILFFVVMLTLD